MKKKYTAILLAGLLLVGGTTQAVSAHGHGGAHRYSQNHGSCSTQNVNRPQPKHQHKSCWEKKDGKWCYYDKQGKCSTGWNHIDKQWYYMDEEGVMQTGWKKVDGTWYCLGKDGAMKSDCWQKSGDKWYCLGKDGAMKKSCWVGNYYVDESGEMLTDTWVDGYYVGSDGAWVKGASMSKPHHARHAHGHMM